MLNLSSNAITPCDAFVGGVGMRPSIIAPPGGLNSHFIKGLGKKMARLPAPSKQLVLDIGVEVERSVNGVEMGVLENGIPFLTQTGLAQMSGVARSVIFDISQDWEEQRKTDVIPAGRMAFIAARLAENGYDEPE